MIVSVLHDITSDHLVDIAFPVHIDGFLHLGDTLILSLFTHAFAPAVLKVLIDLLCSLGFISTICTTFLRRVGRIMPFSSKGETISTSPSSDLLPDTDVSDDGLRLISIRGLLGLRRSSSWPSQYTALFLSPRSRDRKAFAAIRFASSFSMT